jgi:hypothetical protein
MKLIGWRVERRTRTGWLSTAVFLPDEHKWADEWAYTLRRLGHKVRVQAVAP